MILDLLSNAATYRSLSPGIAAALEYLQRTDFSAVSSGRQELQGERLFAIVQRYRAKPAAEAVWEAHRRYIDVQYVAEGAERIGYAPLRPDTKISRPYDSEKDVVFFEAAGEMLTVPAGSFMILGPQDLHAPGVVAGPPSGSSEVCKVVVKCLVESPRDRLIFLAGDEEATARLGHALAELLPDGAVVALCGTLGAGKTRLVQAVAEGMGIDRREVVSPTFVLIQEHWGRRPVYHFDAYRLRDEDEFLALGPEEYFDGDGVTLIEWADRVENCLPPERVEVAVEVIGDTARQFRVAAFGERYAGLISRLEARLVH